MREWDDTLAELADGPGDYERQGGVVLLTRQGRDYALELKEVPGGGPCVAIRDERVERFIPISTYVQQELLGLPRLAKQILKATDRSFGNRPGKFIEGPATCAADSGEREWTKANEGLLRELVQADPGLTRVVQLMAPAGQGKTVLLEEVSRETARSYQPDIYPMPILLTVDLFGRYVGTVDDAIAGSLNNTYLFPGLTQRDIVLCLRRRWLVLALDGFDELVARVGVRDAFNRITELLEQLRGSGTLILSARESFFELYQISSAIRTYLQPKTGGYATMAVKLLPWSEPQALDVFSGLGSAHPDRDLADLTDTFAGDQEIVFHPFFLTRLADLWRKGERFSGADRQAGGLARTKYVIETFIGRESGEKWVDRDQRPLLTAENHVELLSVIAEEMARAGAFRLGVEELRVAAGLAMAELSVSRPVAEMVIERVPTHAAFVSKEKGYAFVHDKFLQFALGHRLATLIVKQDRGALKHLLAARELAPAVIDWATWRLRGLQVYGRAAIEFIAATASEGNDTTTSSNVARLVARIADGDRNVAGLVLQGQVFSGDVLRGGRYYGLSFRECSFWSLDLVESLIEDCTFADCVFSDVRLTEATRLDRSTFDDCQFASVETEEDVKFAPDDIETELRRRGGAISVARSPARVLSPGPRVSTELARCVDKLVRTSSRTCDVVVQDFVESWGQIGAAVIRAGRKHGVLRDVRRDASGPRKEFVRFAVDRDRLLRGQSTDTGDPKIEGFWADVGHKYPPVTRSA